MMDLLISGIAIGYGAYSINTFEKPKSFKAALTTLLTCGKCLAFWVTLIVSQNLTLALLASLTALLLSTFIVTRL